jgi:hypothetical protein
MSDEPIPADVTVAPPPTHAEHLVWVYQYEPDGPTFLLPVHGVQSPENARWCRPSLDTQNCPKARMALVKVSVPLTELR